MAALLLIRSIRRRPRAGADPLENPFRDLAAEVLVEVHLLYSVDREAQLGIGNYAMFIVSAVGRRGRRIAQLSGQYLDQSGNLIPNNVPLVGPNKATQTGVASGVRNGLTHFSNTDPVK
ncbi:MULTISPECIES: hypothetical protein [unclassified Paraburkholderia]|uniref:hypothetical protein n=1 Tax=unclassified Paraburkholderia TaxID=2615204 RepID=UPI002AAFA24C|nr:MULTISPECIES: hypothetical protein [unclassified Paraburkholderia]